MATSVTITLPALTEQQWTLAFDAFAGQVDIPTAPRHADDRVDPNPARTKLATSVAADHGLDELPGDDPRVKEVVEPFLNLSEPEAMKVLFVNNLVWTTGEIPRQRG